MENVKFEESLQRLEEIVSKLESSNTNLDESLKLFQEGIELVKKLEGRLKEVEEESIKILDSAK